MRMSSYEFGVWHSEEKDCYDCLNNNPFSEDINSPLPDKMVNNIFQAMMDAKEVNIRDSEISWKICKSSDD